MRETGKSPDEKIVKDIKRATRKHSSSKEKIRVNGPWRHGKQVFM